MENLVIIVTNVLFVRINYKVEIFLRRNRNEIQSADIGFNINFFIGGLFRTKSWKENREEYFQTYIESKFGEPTSNEESEEWGKEIESYINNLYDSYLENYVLIIY